MLKTGDVTSLRSRGSRRAKTKLENPKMPKTREMLKILGSKGYTQKKTYNRGYVENVANVKKPGWTQGIKNGQKKLAKPNMFKTREK